MCGDLTCSTQTLWKKKCCSFFFFIMEEYTFLVIVNLVREILLKKYPYVNHPYRDFPDMHIALKFSFLFILRKRVQIANVIKHQSLSIIHLEQITMLLLVCLHHWKCKSDSILKSMVNFLIDLYLFLIFPYKKYILIPK